MIGALIVKRKVPAAFDAINQHDLDAFLKNYSDDAAFVYPGDIGPSGIYTGKEAIHWILLVYIGAAIWLFHRQVLQEEDYLKKHYGKEYSEYCNRVRRYF
ncbi:MAG TPA: hypothetical protein VII93_14830 [Anaerolineales bacterium]